LTGSKTETTLKDLDEVIKGKHGLKSPDVSENANPSLAN
jgi:hypothetical protein